MKKICILYGSTLGNTEAVAKTIAEKLDAAIFNVADNPVDALSQYQYLVFGTSTWGMGELQDDWTAFLPELKKADLNGKTIALFGLGDSYTYTDSFVDGMGLIYETIMDRGCMVIGQVPREGYSFDKSKALVSDKFVGLPIDEDNESNLSIYRINNWIEIVRPLMA